MCCLQKRTHRRFILVVSGAGGTGAPRLRCGGHTIQKTCAIFVSPFLCHLKQQWRLRDAVKTPLHDVWMDVGMCSGIVLFATSKRNARVLQLGDALI